MKKLLIAFACIPLLAACKKDDPVPETTTPAVVAPADTTMATPPADTTAVAPVETLPPATQSTEPSSATATTPAPEAASTSGASVAGATQGSGGGMYVVASGDTLWSIAEKNGIAHGDLAKWNNINDPRELQVGRELKLSDQ